MALGGQFEESNEADRAKWRPFCEGQVVLDGAQVESKWPLEARLKGQVESKWRLEASLQ